MVYAMCNLKIALLKFSQITLIYIDINATRNPLTKLYSYPIFKRIFKRIEMAIGFIRFNFVKRSAGKNACAKAAYIGRERIHFEGTRFAEAKIYDWSHKEEVAYKAIFLPSHVNPKYLKAEILWNAAEAKENRHNSQTANEAVLALPDDLEVTLEDKIELVKGFIHEHFVSHGLAVQVAIHPPDAKVTLNTDTGEIEQLEHNWHAHLLVTTRRFKDNGEELADVKARDLMPCCQKGQVVVGLNWVQKWIEAQNTFFESKGMALRVDPNGAISQIHLGPERLRGRAFSLLERNEERKELNVEALKDPAKLVEHITASQNVFTPQDIAGVIYKFLDHKNAQAYIQQAISQPNVIQLLDPKTGQLPLDPATHRPIEKYTTVEVLLEEKRCLNYADRIQEKKAFKVNGAECAAQFTASLSFEQKRAFQNILQGQRLACIEGHAGTGKSYLLSALKKAYEKEGYTVRAFGSDSATAQVLKDKGFSNADNIYHFLFNAKCMEQKQAKQQEFTERQSYWKATQLKKGKPYFAKSKYSPSSSLQLEKGKEIWFVDEATKLGNRPLLQILKMAEKYDVQLIFSGGASQLKPIERGCLFNVFCKRYGSQKLENIQRQKTAAQREMAQKMAKGDMAGAIHQLAASGGLIWVDSQQENKISVQPVQINEQDHAKSSLELKLKDKEKAIEELMKKWAVDREAFPHRTSLIIASSNREVQTLNEMVRTYRKEKGEIAQQDLECETQFGNIFVSEGDTLEFSSNDKKLGVTNGMQGTLIKAAPHEFKVLVKTKDTSREVTFNPNQYASFKLGYATTYFRSQGRTTDRAYILHSIHTNKEMFYVALTRHVHQAYLFVPKSSLNYCAYLKAKAVGYQKPYPEYLALNDYFQKKETQAYLQDLIEQTTQETSKLATTDFVTQTQIAQERRSEYLTSLKKSPSLWNRLKGYTLTTWDQAHAKVEGFQQAKDQAQKDQAFFSPLIESLPEKMRVHESILEPSIKEYRQAFVQSLLPSDTNRAQKDRGKDTTLPSLSSVQVKSLQNYRQTSREASSLYALVQTENEEGKKENKAVPHYTAWQVTCGKRNAAAYELIQNCQQGKLAKVFDKTCLDILNDQAKRHERLLTSKNKPSLDLDERLKDHLEGLLYRLFPEGPSRKGRTEWRFGNKCSLAVVCSGHELGSFYHFEESKGGGPLQLIQETLRLNAKEAREWAQEFLGIAKDLTIPSQFKIKHKQREEKVPWMALKPDINQPAPSLKQLSKLAFYCREEARYAYRDEKGDLLFYTLRLIDKEGKKSTPPLSYGFEKGKNESPHWALRAYQKTEKPLYNLHLLSQNPLAKVVVVEGEKTADAANRLLNKQGMICLTWSGGAKATDKSNWLPLAGREVIIWPDNDLAGFTAATAICSELRKVGVKSLHVVDPDVLAKNFPPKWDLADPLPQDKKETFIRDLLLNAKEKGISAEQLPFISKGDQTHQIIERLQVQEVLWRVEERLRPELEVKLKNKPLEIKQTIIQETFNIWKSKEELAKQLKSQLGLTQEQAERLTFQSMLYKAQKGIEPSLKQLLEVKQLIQNLKGTCLSSFPAVCQTKDLYPLALDKSLTVYIGRPINEKVINEAKLAIDHEMTKVNLQMQSQLRILQFANQQALVKSIDLSL